MPTNDKPIKKLVAKTTEELSEKVASLPTKPLGRGDCQLILFYDKKTKTRYPVCAGVCRGRIRDPLPNCVLRTYVENGLITLFCDCERKVIE